MAAYIFRFLKPFVLLGVILGVIVFILNVLGLEIPMVVGNKTYHGTEAAIMELIGIPVALVLLGTIIGSIAYMSNNSQKY
ncbi:hypothetical protein [Paenibacillus chitinolyticus]|uniref:hypothetical protein n=1 Tax=Paenibacillus chitinolyticus TaxID=79263 RepID=UPI00362B91ED